MISNGFLICMYCSVVESVAYYGLNVERLSHQSMNNKFVIYKSHLKFFSEFSEFLVV